MTERRLKLAFFSNERDRGGAEEHVLTLARGLDRQRFRALWICPPELARRVRPDLPSDIEIAELELCRPRQVGRMAELASILRRWRPDILHSHLFWASLFASPIGRLCGVPVIVETPHVREQWRQGVKLNYQVDRLVSRTVDFYIAVSEANGRYLRDEKGLPEGKIVVIRNGCDLGRFDPQRPAPQTRREQLGIPGDAPILLVLARLEPQKGHCHLIAAIPRILRQFPRAHFVLAGEGRLEAQLKAQCAEAGVAAAVHFVGFQSDVAGWLALCTATILPSLYEGLPLTAMESLAAERAVLASAVDGTPEIVLDNETGLTFPPGDADRLADAVCRALADPEACRRWGRQGRQRVARHFDQSSQLEQTQALYTRAWDRKTARMRQAGSNPAALLQADKENSL